MAVDNSSFLRRDLWLTEMLGYDVFRLEIDDSIFTKMKRVESEERRAIRSMRERNAMVYCKIKPIHLEIADFLFDFGFRLVDTNLTMKVKLTDGLGEGNFDGIRLAVMEDEDDVAQLAKRSFSFSRFHLDPAIRCEYADNLKSEWARNFFRGKRGDAMVVATENSGVVAFLQLVYADSEMVIDLIAVDAAHRGEGIAKKIIRYAIAQGKAFESMKVGTQIANLVSIRLYESLGFTIHTFEHVLHFHNHQ
ncbi:MAG TPA: GNAT family N-acetyltransferase [Syntrophorhabdaceae bacterium]|nr:GNAT family N-acetyltransferase [Syntrophorhabdaceae bacterium]